jgi:tripartite-type tricarboxylate transporter receptor subunit TctC
LFVFVLAVLPARADQYPAGPIRMVVPFPPGGVVDVAARIFAEKLRNILGQPVLIESRPGASGTLGAQTVARATPDGYTLLFSSCDLITISSLKPQVGFDPKTQLLPITIVGSNPLALVANADVPFNDVKGFLQAAKASPQALQYGTPGVGMINQVVGEWIASAAHIKLSHIPFRGGSGAANAIAVGDVPLGIVSPPAVYPALVDLGRIKIIAVTSLTRPSFEPSSWATLAESGLQIDATNWLAVFAPAGTPDAIVSRLDQALSLVLLDEMLRKRMIDIGLNPEHLDPAASAARIRADTARYDQIIKDTGIRVEQ